MQKESEKIEEIGRKYLPIDQKYGIIALLNQVNKTEKEVQNGKDYIDRRRWRIIKLA